MARFPRICLLASCAVLLGAPPALGEAPAVGGVANPARLPGSIPLTVSRKTRAKAPSLGTRAVRLAAQEIGAPYRYGGMSPTGFDCSGLVAYVYGKLGVHLPHNAAGQYSYGRPVSRGKLRPGDLVFFHGLGHVGLYIGRGRIIHAPQSGRRVEVQRLSDRGGVIEGARRLIRA